MALLALWVAVSATTRMRPAGAAAPGAGGISLLALGDTGKPVRWPPLFDGQIVVADALVREASRRPVEAIVLLGDNFYFHGLDRAHLVQRVRENLVGPYCYFVDLTGPRSREVASACALPSAQRRPTPLFAVLGNHDHLLPESAALESEAIPAFVSNWTLPRSPAAAVELPGGVSLVLADSTTLDERRDMAPLRDALRSAHGPWRVVVSHHPVGPGDDDGSWSNLVRAAIADAGVPVQLLLAGHRHSLQVIELAAPSEPGLVVIAGGGSSTRRERVPAPERRFLAESFGFARVDFVGRPVATRAIVSLARTSRLRWLFGLDAQLVTRWSVDADGRAHDEGLTAAGEPEDPT